MAQNSSTINRVGSH